MFLFLLKDPTNLETDITLKKRSVDAPNTVVKLNKTTIYKTIARNQNPNAATVDHDTTVWTAANGATAATADPTANLVITATVDPTVSIDPAVKTDSSIIYTDAFSIRQSSSPSLNSQDSHGGYLSLDYPDTVAPDTDPFINPYVNWVNSFNNVYKTIY